MTDNYLEKIVYILLLILWKKTNLIVLRRIKSDKIRVIKVNNKFWSEICFYLLKQSVLIFLSLLLILLSKKAYPSINQLLKLCLIITIDPDHHDMKIKHWENTVEFLLKDTHDMRKNILNNNLKKIVYRLTSFIFTNAKTSNYIKAKITKMLKFTGVYHYKLTLMTLLLKIYITSFTYFNFL